MTIKIGRLSSATLLIGALALGGCGVGGSGSSGATPTTAAEKPTDRPKPTTKPTDKPKATEKPTAKPKPTDRPAAGGNKAKPIDESTLTVPVDLADPQPYKHESGIFALEVPASWSVDDRSTDELIFVGFSDPSNNAQMIVQIVESEPMDEAQMTTALQEYVKSVFGTEENFDFEEPVPQADGSVLLVWSSEQSLTNSKTATFTGNSFIEQREDLLSIITLAVPKEQFPDLKAGINTLLNSYKIDPSAQAGGGDSGDTGSGDPAPAGEALADLSNLTTYEYETGIFKIDVPGAWNVTDTSDETQNTVSFVDPSGHGSVYVYLSESFDNLGDDALTEALKAYIEAYAGSQPNFWTKDPVPQSDGSIRIAWGGDWEVGGATYSYTGNSFVEQRDSIVSMLTIIAPSEQFKAEEGEIGKILGSYALSSAVKVGK
ncbi:MAG TPA: hypothetical protein VGE07_03050 [Herpetosiphonaceae bacterium]